MRRKIRLGRILLGFVAAAVLLVGVALVGNSYRYEQNAVVIPGPEGDLAGVLTVPSRGPARGLVVMIHGDGPVDSTQNGLYAPWFEAAADAGFATLSWSKPGVGGSDGDWLAQSLDDRAAEVSAAIDWARLREDVPTDLVVLWGASQAGWVFPQVVRDREDIDAVVAVGTAITWLDQGRYHLLSDLDHQGADPQEREAAIAQSDMTRALLERGATYQEYLASSEGTEVMTEARWGFVLRNFRADATPALSAAAADPLPVHLMVGTQDRHVDVAETEETYRSILGDSLTVTHADAAHSLARPIMEDNDLVGLVTGVLWPRALLAPGVTDDYTAFLSQVAPRA